MGAEPGGRAARGRAGQPGVLDHLGQLLDGYLADAACAQQHGQVAIEVRGGEERGRLVLDQRLLVRVRRDPEDHHVRVALPGLGVRGVGPGVAEEYERLSADLVDLVATASLVDRDVGHPQRQLVDVLDPSRPAPVLPHEVLLAARARLRPQPPTRLVMEQPWRSATRALIPAGNAAAAAWWARVRASWAAESPANAAAHSAGSAFARARIAPGQPSGPAKDSSAEEPG